MSDDIRTCRDCGAKILLLPNLKRHLIPVEPDAEPFQLVFDAAGTVRVFREHGVFLGRPPRDGEAYIDVVGHRLHRDVCGGARA